MRPNRVGSVDQEAQGRPSDAFASSDVEKGLRRPGANGEDGYRGSRHSSDAEQGGSGANTPRRKEHGKGLTEGDQDMDALPKNNLLLVMPAIGLVLFLAALDMSIVSTALPTIATELHATPSEYSWVGTAYLLAATVMNPLNGRVSDIIGRKPMVYSAIVIFFIASALCGAAKNMTWLITARAFQGLGGGSIIGLTNMIVSDIVPLSKRGTYQGWIGGTWGIAATLGPILGGLLTDKASWRWTFYINLPTCGAAFVLLFFTLKLNPTRKHTFRELSQTFDFLGMALMIAGAALLVVGFAEAADFGWDDASAYGVIAAGAVIMIAAIVNCLFTKRIAVIPARMFRIRTTSFFLLASLLQAMAFLPANYLLPQLFQGVRGSSALRSGLELLPFSVIVAVGTIIAGNLNSRLRIIRPVAWVGYAMAALGFGLLYGLYRWPFSVATQEGILVIGGLGIGLSLAVPLLILQAAMPLKEMAATTSAWTLTRNLGGSIGLAVFTAVLNTQLRSRFERIPGYGVDFEVPESGAGYRALQDLPEGEMKQQVLRAFSDSLGVCWIIECAMFLLCLLITLWTKSYSLDRGPKVADSRVAGDAHADDVTAAETATGDEKGALPDAEAGVDDAQARGRISQNGTPLSEETVVGTPWERSLERPSSAKAK